MAGRRRLIAPAVVVVLATVAVVALGDPDAEVSKAAALVAAAAVGALIVAVTTGVEHRDQHPFPYGVLLLRLAPIPVVLMGLLVLWLLPDGEQSGDEQPDLGSEEDEPAPGERDEPGVQPSDIIDTVYTVLLVAAVVVGVLVARSLIRRWIRVRRPPAGVPGATGAVTESDDPEQWRRQANRRVVLGGLERGRSALLDEADPRLAIIAAYLAFEDHVRREGMVRDPAETQREYAARVLAAGDVDDPRRVTELVELFNAARFSTDPLGEADAVAARDHIDVLVGV